VTEDVKGSALLSRMKNVKRKGGARGAENCRGCMRDKPLEKFHAKEKKTESALCVERHKRVGRKVLHRNRP